MIRTGFYIPRLNYLKIFCPVIEEFLSRDARVTLFLDQRESLVDGKSHLRPDMEKVPAFGDRVERIPFRSVSGLAGMARDRDVQAMVFLDFDAIGERFREEMLRLSHPVVIAQLQHAFELVYLGRDLGFSDVVYTFSPSWSGWWKAYVRRNRLVPEREQEALFKAIDEKAVPVGFPEADQLKDIISAEVYEKYRIPRGKRVLLYLPYCWTRRFSLCSHASNRVPGSMLGPMRRVCCRVSGLLPEFFCGMLDRHVVDAVREFCNANDAVFIVKAREKTVIPRYLETMADRVIFDESYYPFTTLELLLISDLCLHFYSSTVLEAVAAGTPSICIFPGTAQFRGLYGDRFFMPDFSPRPGSFYNFEGVNYHVAQDRFTACFPGQAFSDYPLDEKSAGKFMNRFAGPGDLNSCTRIYEDLEQRIRSMGRRSMVRC